MFGINFHLGHKDMNRVKVKIGYEAAFEYKKHVSFLDALFIISGREDYFIQKGCMYPKVPYYVIGHCVRIHGTRSTYRNSHQTNFNI